jgi:hypothetical protein
MYLTKNIVAWKVMILKGAKHLRKIIEEKKDVRRTSNG